MVISKIQARLVICAAGLAICLLAPAAVRADPIDYKALYRDTAPGIVVVLGTNGFVVSRGTGSIISRGGLVLTNCHVVAYRGGGWPSLYVFTKPDKISGNAGKDLSRRYRAKLVAANPQYDLALLQIIDAPRSLNVLPLSDMRGVGVGEPTVAIGHPGGGALWSLTTGKLSAMFKDYGGIAGWDVIQMETAINPGNSGGPLLDGAGSIIGVNTFIKRKGDKGIALVGLSFAVQSTTARSWIKSVMGKLPPASVLARKNKKAQHRPPPPEAVKKAAPPKHEKLAAPTRGEPKKQWRLKAAPGQKRKDGLARKRRRPGSGFTSDIMPGQVYSESSLKKLSARSKATFEEMDRVMGNKPGKGKK